MGKKDATRFFEACQVSGGEMEEELTDDGILIRCKNMNRKKFEDALR